MNKARIPGVGLGAVRSPSESQSHATFRNRTLMAQEPNEGTAYLMALRQATGAAPAPAREPGLPDHRQEAAMPPDTTENFQGAEKRRSPRYKCEGSAEVREDGCDVRTWATFTDISLNGCYVEAQATYPAGTIIHMKLEANGARVETKGVVRVSYPYLGMGIAFEGMSDENIARLKQVLGRLSRPAVIVGPGVKSSQPSAGPMESLPPVTHPETAVRALIEHFELHQVLMRDDFVRLLKSLK